MCRRGIAALPLVVLVAILALPGCGDDKTSNPPPTQKLGDLELTLEFSNNTPQVSDTVTAAVFVHNADPDVLDDLDFAWKWGSMRGSGPPTAGMSRALVQPAKPGQLHVEVVVSNATNGVTLTADRMVPGVVADGSFDMITIYEGPFLRGERSDQTAFISFTPQRTITLSRFSLARTEMTNAACAEILTEAATRGELTGTPLDSPPYLLWTPTPLPPREFIVADQAISRFYWDGTAVRVYPGYEDFPVLGLTWQGAALVCNWLSIRDGLEPAYTLTPTLSIHGFDITCDFFADGYRLPTEAEWEKAARGGLVLAGGANPYPDRRYPWGNEDPRVELAHGREGSVRANVSVLWDTVHQQRGPIFSGALPVGSFPLGAGPYGHLDLLGNAAEWCWDWVDLGYYSVSPTDDPEGADASTIFPTVNDWKALRGDSWERAFIPRMDAYTSEEGCGKRRWAGYNYEAWDVGIRLARSER
jgi:formylglycine-generating enzyme required for sulfatase activity